MTDETAAVAAMTATRPEVRRGHVPGEGGIWVLIGGDLVLFSVLFIVFLTMRAEQLPVFEQGRAQLNQGWGLLNTLLMLSSSWFVATAIRAARLQLPRMVARCFGAALACGMGFVVVKFFEYGEKISAGLTLTTNDFFMLYFVYTGIHLIHVTIGMGVLTFLIAYSRSGVFAGDKLRNLESGASFWHLVDLLWIVLFALLYLVGAP
jgi:nitric oxide reductase NorE protein